MPLCPFSRLAELVQRGWHGLEGVQLPCLGRTFLPLLLHHPPPPLSHPEASAEEEGTGREKVGSPHPTPPACVHISAWWGGRGVPDWGPGWLLWSLCASQAVLPSGPGPASPSFPPQAPTRRPRLGPPWWCTRTCWCSLGGGHGPALTPCTSQRGSLMKSTRTRPPRTGKRCLCLGASLSWQGGVSLEGRLL